VATTRILKRVGLAVLGAAIVFATTTTHIAHADPSTAEAELTTARALFEEGLAREDARDWAGALERFRRVTEIRQTPQVIYNIALCLEHLGKVASADKQYARTEKAAEGSSEGSVHEIARLATARRSAIRPTIPEITLDAPASETANLKVVLDGSPVPSQSLRSSFAIDPGKHEVVVTRRGNDARRSFNVDLGAHAVIALPLPIDTPPPKDESTTVNHSVPISAWITGGVGVVAIGVGVFAVISRSSAMSDLDKACVPNRDACPESKRSEVDRVTTMTTLANISFITAGIAAIATGAIMYFTWKPTKQAAVVFITPQLGGVAFSGLF